MQIRIFYRIMNTDIQSTDETEIIGATPRLCVKNLKSATNYPQKQKNNESAGTFGQKVPQLLTKTAKLLSRLAVQNDRKLNKKRQKT